MILTGNSIVKENGSGKILITPFLPERVTTNTYDLALGKKLLRYTVNEIDPKKETPYELFEIPEDGYLMEPGEFLLGSTEERIGSDYYVPLIHSKSGIARMGLFVHITADIIDIGFHGQSTLQLYATLPLRLYPGMLIAQVSFWVPKGKISLYNGKYQSSYGPQPSRIYRDFR